MWSGDIMAVLALVSIATNGTWWSDAAGTSFVFFLASVITYYLVRYHPRPWTNLAAVVIPPCVTAVAAVLILR